MTNTLIDILATVARSLETANQLSGGYIIRHASERMKRPGGFTFEAYRNEQGEWLIEFPLFVVCNQHDEPVLALR